MKEIPSKSNRSPGRSQRWLRAVWISGALLAGAVLLGMLFLMHRPETLHPLLEKTLSAVTGLSIRYQHLSLDLAAGKLQVENLHISSGPAIQDIEISVPRLRVRYRHSGGLTDGVLVLEQVDLQAPDIRLGPGFEIPAPSMGGQPTDRHDAPFRWKVPAVVVSEVRLRALSASSGRLELETGTIIAHCNDVALHLEDSGRLTLQTTPSIQWPRAHVTAGADRMTADFSRRADGNIGGSIQTVAGKLQATPLTAGEMAIEFEAAFDPLTKDLRVDQSRLQGRLSLAEGPTRRFSLGGRGNYRTAENTARVSHWQMVVPDLAQASGTAEWNPDGSGGLALRLQEARVATAGAKDFIESLLEKRWPAFDISGPLALQGWLEGVPGTPLADWRSESTWTLDRIQVGFDRGRHRLSGRLGGRLQLSGGLVQPASEFQLILESEDLQAGGARIGAGRIKLTGSGPLRTPKVSVDANIAAFFVAGEVQSYGFRNIRMNAADGRIELIRAAVHLPDLKVTSDEIGRFQGSFRAEGGEIFTNMQSSDASLLQLAAAWRLMPENWHGRSRDRLQLSFHRRADGNGSLNARLDINGLGFNSPDNRILAENLQLEAALDCRLAAGTARATLSTTAATGEVLWGRHYLDIAAEPLSLDGSATYRTKDRFLSFEGWKLVWQHQGAITASGHIELDRRPAPSMHFDLNVPKTPLSPLFNRWLVEPYRFEHPALESLAIDGSVSATLTVRKNASKWAVEGLTTLREGSFQYRDREVILDGIELNLPIWLIPESTTAAGQPRQGNLSISKLSLPFLPVQPLSAPLTVEPNRIRFPEPLLLKLAAGSVTLGPTALLDIHNPALRVETELQVDAVGLDPFLGAYWPRFIEGELNGRLSEIRYRNGKVTTRGNLHADVFGGRIDLSEIALLHPFTSIAVLKLDAQIHSLLLEALTGGTSFGKIQGVMEGHIQNLEVVRGQPQRFDLLLETVRRPGVDQSINIRAVENIARIGGGQSPFIGMAGVMGAIFKEFQYRKIGVRASLKNDVFHINGTIRENGTEYLVKSGGLPGVDVINSNPDNRIRFKDMVKRIQRIGSTSAGPVIR